MDDCKGTPRDPDQGFPKICPVRYKCHRYLLFSKQRHTGNTMEGPYSFEDDECGKFLER